MKANEFVKKYGWEEAQFLIDEWDGETTNWSLDTGFVYVGKSVDTHMLCVETLQRLVESRELVVSLGGAEKCKGYVQVCFYKGRDTYGNRLKQAIVDVESCQ